MGIHLTRLNNQVHLFIFLALQHQEPCIPPVGLCNVENENFVWKQFEVYDWLVRWFGQHIVWIIRPESILYSVHVILLSVCVCVWYFILSSSFNLVC
jgi:hypothetical protein